MIGRTYRTYTDDPSYWMAVARAMYAVDDLVQMCEYYGEAIRLWCMEDSDV